ncbi:MAG TPA: hypothetical protein VG406_00665, partial [Isosphaeraceae bacterium]|nr:hypothetical protein [Isosphaeraceae bacterium]
SHFFAGTTDLRGVFVAEGVHGVVTAVARQGTHRYAFYRGKQFVGTPPAPTAPAQLPAGATSINGQAPADQPGWTLEQNLKALNTGNRARQLERLQNRYAPDRGKGVQAQEAP